MFIAAKFHKGPIFYILEGRWLVAPISYIIIAKKNIEKIDKALESVAVDQEIALLNRIIGFLANSFTLTSLR